MVIESYCDTKISTVPHTGKNFKLTILLIGSILFLLIIGLKGQGSSNIFPHRKAVTGEEEKIKMLVLLTCVVCEIVNASGDVDVDSRGQP